MNIQYLDTLPEVENKYGFNLQYGEKAVFVAQLPIFGTEKDKLLGTDSKFTLTNKRILIDNGAGLWTNDIAEDVVACSTVESKFLFHKSYYVSLTLNKEVEYNYGKEIMSGFHFYFKKSDLVIFEEIMSHLLS